VSSMRSPIPLQWSEPNCAHTHTQNRIAVTLNMCVS